jgi:hypothetical protein
VPGAPSNLTKKKGRDRHHYLVCLRVCPTVPVIARSVADLPVRKLDHEALPSGIIIPLAGVLGAGEAVSCRKLERSESIEVSDPGVVLGILGREVVHEEADVVGIEPAVSG